MGFEAAVNASFYLDAFDLELIKKRGLSMVLNPRFLFMVSVTFECLYYCFEGLWRVSYSAARVG